MGLLDFFRAPPATLHDFLRELGRTLQSLGDPPLRIGIDDDPPSIAYGRGLDGEVLRLHVREPADRYVGAGVRERKRILESTAKDVRELLVDHAARRPFVPWLHRASHLAMLKRATIPSMPVRPIAGVLAISPARIEYDGILGVDLARLDALQLTEERAFERATTTARGLDPQFVSLTPGLWAARGPGELTAVAALLAEKLPALAGAPVLALPRSGLALLADAAVPEAVAALAELTAEAFPAQPDYLTGHVFTRGLDGWIPYLPDASAPAFRLLRTLRRDSAWVEATEWSTALETIRSLKPPVPSRAVARDGTPLLSLEWTPDATVVPRTDVVVSGAFAVATDALVSAGVLAPDPLEVTPPGLRLVTKTPDFASLPAFPLDRGAGPGLVPVLVSPFAASQQRLLVRANAPSGDIVFPRTPEFPAFGDLRVAVMSDIGEALQTVDVDTLAKDGFTAESALDRAFENLQPRTYAPFLAIALRLHRAAWTDDSAAARLLVPSVRARLRALDLPGGPVVFVPNRSVIVVAAANDAASLERAAAEVANCLESPRLLTGAAFRVTESGLEPFTAAEGTSAHAALRRAADLVDDAMLRQQDGFLARIHSGATPALRTRTDGRLVSTCKPGRTTLLSRSDTVVVTAAGSAGPVHVAWEPFVAQLGERLVPIADAFPPRWLAPARITVEDVAAWKKSGGLRTDG